MEWRLASGGWRARRPAERSRAQAMRVAVEGAVRWFGEAGATAEARERGGIWRRACRVACGVAAAAASRPETPRVVLAGDRPTAGPSQYGYGSIAQ